MLNKESLINDLKKIHQDITEVYRKIFDFKYQSDQKFKTFVDAEYKREKLSKVDEKKAWEEKFIHRSAYTLLNKFLFIRICEDKGFMLNDEDTVMGVEVNRNAGKKLSIVGLQKWSELITNYSLSELIRFSFKDMSRSYNNLPLYKEDKYDWLIPNQNEIEMVLLDSKKSGEIPYYDFEILLRRIIETLDVSNYNFDESSDTVLGDVYEKFMDRETRKALGQFYTPEYVIDYILENTVKKANVVKNPFIKVFDPSCGSGHFLIMAYDLLKEKFIESLPVLRDIFKDNKYEVKVGDSRYYVYGSEYWTEKYLHYHLLKHCIYGADIDGFALQLTTINLLLKDLDNVFIDELNIIECDSLIKWEKDYNWQNVKEQLREEELLFNVQYRDISGNSREEIITIDQAHELIKRAEIWNQRYEYIIGNPPWISLSGKHEQSIDFELLQYYIDSHGGNTYMPNLYEFFIRRLLEKVTEDGMFSFVIPDRFAENGQFKNLRKRIVNEFTINNLIFEVKFPDVIADAMIFAITNQVQLTNKVVIGNLENSYEVIQNEFNDGENFAFKFYKDQTFQRLINKVKKSGERLGNICDTTSGFGGKSTEITEKRINPEQIKVLKGDSIERYGKRGYYYFDFKKENITGRTTDRNKLGANRKILIRKTGDKIISCYDDSRMFPEQSLYFVYNLKSKFDYLYILGLLNSRLINFYYSNELLTNRNSTAQVKKVDLDNIPILEVEPKVQHDIISIVEQIVDMWTQLYKFDFHLNEDENTILEYGIKYEELTANYHTLQYQLDKKIFELYNLTSEEIDIVNKDFSIINYEYDLFKNVINEFHEDLSTLKLTKIAKKYKTEVSFVSKLRSDIINHNNISKEELLTFYNFSELYNSIKNLIGREIKLFFLSLNKYLNLNEIIELCEENIDNFNVLINILKGNQTIKTEKIIGEILNKKSATISSFLKQKTENEFVKYERDFYGLWEWGNENHKQYFVDFINYNTTKNGIANTVIKNVQWNEKKAKSALNVLKQMKFKDKEDYIEILTERIRKAFE